MAPRTQLRVLRMGFDVIWDVVVIFMLFDVIGCLARLIDI